MSCNDLEVLESSSKTIVERSLVVTIFRWFVKAMLMAGEKVGDKMEDGANRQ